MKRIVLVLPVVLALLGAAQLLRAEDAKETTLMGSMVCGKCTLKETDKCTDVLQVKDGDKTVNYYLVDNDVAKKFHGHVCKADSSANVNVTGTVAEKDGKKWLTASKIEAVKDGGHEGH